MILSMKYINFLRRNKYCQFPYLIANNVQVFIDFQSALDEFAQSFIVHHVVNAVTRHHEELVLVLKLQQRNFG